MQFLSLYDIEQGLKKKLYEIVNRPDGAALVWDAQKRQYIGHVDLPKIKEEAQQSGLDISEWVRYGDGDWGSSGW